MESEVQKLENFLNVYVNTINTLLPVYGTETMALRYFSKRSFDNERGNLFVFSKVSQTLSPSTQDIESIGSRDGHSVM